MPLGAIAGLAFWNAFLRRADPISLGVVARNVAVVLLVGAVDWALHLFIRPEVNQRIAEVLFEEWIIAFLRIGSAWAGPSL